MLNAVAANLRRYVDIGMSRQNVAHYMRFGDQMKVGADGQKRLVDEED